LYDGQGEQVEKDQEMTDYRLQAEVEKVEMGILLQYAMNWIGS
jgi:hypothetical protein